MTARRRAMLASAPMRRWSVALTLVAAAWTASPAGAPAREPPAPPPPAAPAPPEVALTATRPETGWVALRVRAGSPARIRVFEQVRGRRVGIGTLQTAGSGGVRIARAVRWRCDRRTRVFVAVATTREGARAEATSRVTTPSCRGRLAVAVNPSRPRAGARVTVEVRDRWRVGGVVARVCRRAPGARRSVCRSVALRATRTRNRLLFRPERAGRWAVSVGAGRIPAVRRSLGVRTRRPGLRVLATGDSMMQLLDGS